MSNVTQVIGKINNGIEVLYGTSSWANNAISASYAQASLSSSWCESGSYFSYINVDVTRSYTFLTYSLFSSQSIYATSSLFAISASWASSSISSSYTGTASLAVSTSWARTASFITSASYARTASFAATSSAPWITTGSNIYYTKGNASVGTTSSINKFNIKGSGTIGPTTFIPAVPPDLDDAIIGGVYMGSDNGSITYQVVVANDGGVNYGTGLTPVSGGVGYNVNDTFTVDGGGQLATGIVTGETGNVVTSYSILTSGNSYSPNADAATTATSGGGAGLTILTTDIIDTFTWAKTGGGSSVSIGITTTAQALSDGIIVTFGSNIGHGYGGQWNATVTMSCPLDIRLPNNDTAIYVCNSGKVGIGTTTAVNKLDVVGNISCSIITASFLKGNVTGSVFGTASWARTASFATSASYPWNVNGANISYVAGVPNTSGYVGIGTANPNCPLHISASKTPQIKWEGIGTYAEFQMVDNRVGAVTYAFLNGYPEVGDFTIRESGTANRLIIKKTTGLVGIGVANPTNSLDVSGNISCSVITASLFGSASYATSASWSPVPNYTSSLYGTASWAVSASYAPTGSPATYTSSLFGTASWTVSASYATNAGTAYAINFVPNASAFTTQSLYATQSLYSTQSLYASQSINAYSASWVSASVLINSAQVATQSLFASQSINAYSASWVSSSAFITTAQTASYISSSATFDIGKVYNHTASYATSASWSPGGSPATYTSSLYGTASWANTASAVINSTTRIVEDSASFGNGTLRVDSSGNIYMGIGDMKILPGQKVCFGASEDVAPVQYEAATGNFTFGIYGTISNGSLNINSNGVLTAGPSVSVKTTIDSVTGNISLIGGAGITSPISASKPIEYQNSASITGTPSNTTTPKGFVKMTLDGVQYFMPLYQ